MSVQAQAVPTVPTGFVIGVHTPSPHGQLYDAKCSEWKTMCSWLRSDLDRRVRKALNSPEELEETKNQRSGLNIDIAASEVELDLLIGAGDVNAFLRKFAEHMQNLRARHDEQAQAGPSGIRDQQRPPSTAPKKSSAVSQRNKQATERAQNRAMGFGFDERAAERLARMQEAEIARDAAKRVKWLQDEEKQRQREIRQDAEAARRTEEHMKKVERRLAKEDAAAERADRRAQMASRPSTSRRTAAVAPPGPSRAVSLKAATAAARHAAADLKRALAQQAALLASRPKPAAAQRSTSRTVAAAPRATSSRAALPRTASQASTSRLAAPPRAETRRQPAPQRTTSRNVAAPRATSSRVAAPQAAPRQQLAPQRTASRTVAAPRATSSRVVAPPAAPRQQQLAPQRSRSAAAPRATSSRAALPRTASQASTSRRATTQRAPSVARTAQQRPAPQAPAPAAPPAVPAPVAMAIPKIRITPPTPQAGQPARRIAAPVRGTSRTHMAPAAGAVPTIRITPPTPQAGQAVRAIPVPVPRIVAPAAPPVAATRRIPAPVRGTSRMHLGAAAAAAASRAQQPQRSRSSPPPNSPAAGAPDEGQQQGNDATIRAALQQLEAIDNPPGLVRASSSPSMISASRRYIEAADGRLEPGGGQQQGVPTQQQQQPQQQPQQPLDEPSDDGWQPAEPPMAPKKLPVSYAEAMRRAIKKTNKEFSHVLANTPELLKLRSKVGMQMRMNTTKKTGAIPDPMSTLDLQRQMRTGKKKPEPRRLVFDLPAVYPLQPDEPGYHRKWLQKLNEELVAEKGVRQRPPPEDIWKFGMFEQAQQGFEGADLSAEIKLQLHDNPKGYQDYIAGQRAALAGAPRTLDYVRTQLSRRFVDDEEVNVDGDIAMAQAMKESIRR